MMKRNYFKFAMLTAVAVTTMAFTSCKDDEKPVNNADGDENEPERGDSVAFQYVFCAIIHIFANWAAK